MGSNAAKSLGTDPRVYDEYKVKWRDIPMSASDWVQRAVEVANVLAVDAGHRERENKSPRAEIALLKHAGLLKVLGSREFGGGGQPWSVAYKVIQQVARGDGYDLPSHFQLIDTY